MDTLNATTWIIDGRLIQSIEINEEETLCSPKKQGLTIGIANRFKNFKDAMNTCEKISRVGAKMTEIQTKDQFQLFHKDIEKKEVKFN